MKLENDNSRRLLSYTCWQDIRPWYSCTDPSVRSISEIANSSEAFTRTTGSSVTTAGSSETTVTTSDKPEIISYENHEACQGINLTTVKGGMHAEHSETASTPVDN